MLNRHLNSTSRSQTVSLLDRVTAGTFSDRLFYRLNVIHLMQGDRSNGGPAPIGPP